jgi:dTDP-4-dehydrorhamnose reductase
MRILITGGRGQLGQELRAAFAAHTVSAPGHAELDVTDAGSVGRAVDAFRPELVIHAAAYTDTRGCEADPALAMRVNGDGTRHVALACRQAGAALLYISTNEVFDGAKGEPYLETDEPRPVNAYGRSKLAGEEHVWSLLQKSYVVRTAWLYGGGRDFLARVLQAATGELPMVTDEVASPTWARDLAQAIARLVEQDAPPGVYHLTNGGGCSRFQWAERVLALAGRQDVVLRPVTQAEYGAPYRKPAFSELANTAAAALGVVLRPWLEALAAYLVTPLADRPFGGAQGKAAGAPR